MNAIRNFDQYCRNKALFLYMRATNFGEGIKASVAQGLSKRLPMKSYGVEVINNLVYKPTKQCTYFTKEKCYGHR
jgi:hypothetical protein